MPAATVAERKAQIVERIAAYEDSQADYALAVMRYRAQARRLRDALRERGITLEAFARECGCSPSNVASYLAPHSVSPLPAYVWRTAERLGLV